MTPLREEEEHRRENRFLGHPNYVVVVAEIAVLPLAFGLVGPAILLSALNVLVLWIRARAEARALRN
ncbi:isoprenylcysteine carboxylmethyltransferase family protein [Phenylobacterium ferrooxidans]|uniref:isoprenylcysteine carboxylmethyltransferase family protein n=1 Tax=Phenylobacterium ferrooxidans TaxID=2982689 RepID=UPI00366D3DFF